MAQAILQKRPIRDAIAIAERPDGSRVAFRPYPTPLFDEHGKLTGAVNMLIDVTEEQSERFTIRPTAAAASRKQCTTANTSKMLGDMADGFDRTATELAKQRR